MGEFKMINAHEVVPDCNNVSCTHLLYTGRCLDRCLSIYKSGLGASGGAYWKSRANHNDFLWVECSNCGFRVENYKAVVCGKSSTDYVDVQYKFCPMCGKEMRV